MVANGGFVNNTQTTTGEAFGNLWSWETVWAFILKLMIALAVVGLLILLARIFARFVGRRLKASSIVDDEYTNKVSGLVSEIIFYTLLVLSLLIGFSIVGIDFGWILGGISFGIGFAFKEILGNLIAGVLVLTNNEFKLGDVIVVEDRKKEYFGRIEEITIRYTVIRTFDLRKVIVPNLTLITQPVRTYDSEEIVRLDLNFTLHYGTNINQAQTIIKEAVNSVDYVKEKGSTKVSVSSFGDHGIEFLVYFYLDPKGGVFIHSAKSGVFNAIFDALKDHDMVIPYPHTTLTVDHNDTNLLGSMLYVAKESKNFQVQENQIYDMLQNGQKNTQQKTEKNTQQKTTHSQKVQDSKSSGKSTSTAKSKSTGKTTNTKPESK